MKEEEFSECEASKCYNKLADAINPILDEYKGSTGLKAMTMVMTSSLCSYYEINKEDFSTIYNHIVINISPFLNDLKESQDNNELEEV